MLAFEVIEELGYPDLAWEFNGKSKEEAEELCRIHGIPNAHYMLERWDEYIHIRPPTLEVVFAFSDISHLLDEFCETVHSRQQAIEFSEKHNLKPHQADNLKLHWDKARS